MRKIYGKKSKNTGKRDKGKLWAKFRNIWST